MLKRSDLLETPITVLDQQCGEQVKDWIFDIQNNRTLGLLVKKGGWKGGARVLLWESIRYISPRAVITVYDSPVIEIGQVLQVKSALENQITIIGREIVTRNGQTLGKIIDLYIDESTGVIVGLAVHRRLDASSGSEQVFLPLFDPLLLIDGFAVAAPGMVGATRENGTHHSMTPLCHQRINWTLLWDAEPSMTYTRETV